MIHQNHKKTLHILVLEGYCKQTLPFIRSFKKHDCEVTVLCQSKLDCAYASRLPDHKILGTCDISKPHESEQYILDLIRTGKYDIVYSPFDFSSSILANNKDELSQYSVIVSNDKNIYDIASNKEEVMKTCMSNDIPCPKTYFGIESVDKLISSQINFPIIIKPRNMYGARGFHQFNSADELIIYLKDNNLSISDYVVQEFIPLGSDVCSGVLYIDRFGDVKSEYVYASKHLYPENGGTSTLNVLIDRPDILRSCKQLAKLLDLKGLIGIDLMIDKRDNIGKIIEINVRAPHAIEIGFQAGIDSGQQILEDATKKEVTQMSVIKRDFCLRILQTDVLWFLSSPDRLKKTPKKLGFPKVKEQMFYWDDPMPWLAFLLEGLRDFKKKMKEKRK